MSSAAKLTQSTQPHTPVSSHLSPRISRYTPPSSPSQSRVKRVGGFIVTLPDYRDLYKNLSRTPITSIDHPKLEDGEEVDIKITDFRAVSSYNWEDQKEPLIIVPGLFHGGIVKSVYMTNIKPIRLSPNLAGETFSFPTFKRPRKGFC